VQISGGLGESETGGATINIIPRTGGNTFAGNYFLSYTQILAVVIKISPIHK
jgi:hypothetical protein